MKRLPLYLFAPALILLVSAPAEAQSNVGSGSIKINKNQLDDASKMPKGRKIIDIIDESPEIHDLRRSEAPNNVIINIPPLQPTPGTTTVINLPGQTAGPGSTVGGPGTGGPGGGPAVSGNRPGQVVIDLNRLPSAGPESHMNSLNRGINRNLPSGTSTGVHVQVALPPKNNGTPAVTGNSVRPVPGNGAPKAPPVTMMQPSANYKNAGTETLQGAAVHTGVTGRRVHPGLERLKQQ